MPRTGVPPAAAAEPAVPSIDTLVTWIPGEVIATYSAIVLVLQPEDGGLEVTSVGLLIAGIVAAGPLTWLGGWSKTDDLDARATKELLLRTGLATVAFAIWSFVVPGAAWYDIASVAEDADVFPLAAALVGAAFALLAEGLVRRVAKP
ncbi:MAG TPA: hypothetical protein VHF89_11910 [Solirubrobacteraceae bacterium]|nr:hypothetical protein [Solirubrobacteraceae bacterium]